MGTRHSQTVITKIGETKICQYGQWDGYPSGQGVEILAYLKGGDLDKYQEELNKISVINKKQIDLVDSDSEWAENYPYLSRNCGASIHQMIEDGEVKFVQHMDKETREWIKGFYTIDFKKGVFITEYGEHKVEFKISQLPTKGEYLRRFEDDEF